MKNSLKLNGEEVKLLQDFDYEEFKRINDFKEEKVKLEEVAHNFLQKDKPIDIRKSSRDLENPKKPQRKGFPAKPPSQARCTNS